MLTIENSPTHPPVQCSLFVCGGPDVMLTVKVQAVLGAWGKQAKMGGQLQCSVVTPSLSVFTGLGDTPRAPSEVEE